MPEEAEILEDTNNANNQGNYSSSSPKEKKGKVLDKIVDFNKYKSRKNKNKGGAEKHGNSKPSTPNIGRNAVNGLKNKATNAMLNKVSNAHPALKALSVLNNDSKARKAKKATQATKDEKTKTDSDTGDNKSNENSTNTEDSTKEKSFNPLSSLFGFNKGFLGKFSLFGRLPLPLKLAIILGGPLFGLLILIMPFIIIMSYFGGLFGASEVVGGENFFPSSGNIDYGDYQLSSDGDVLLHQALNEFLSSKGTSLEEFNNLISSNVEDAGYGTRAGVVAAAVTLIGELGNNYNVKIPYFFGGGHGQIQTGAVGNWGSSQCHSSARGHSYNYCGLDCSGFVSWAIYNGGFNISARSAGTFQNLPGAKRVSLTNKAVLQPGDILESSGHVILVIGVDDKNYICAEAAGKSSGVTFSTKKFNVSNYWGVNMEGFYNGKGQVRS